MGRIRIVTETSAAVRRWRDKKIPFRWLEVVMAALLTSAITFVAVVVYIGASKEKPLDCNSCPVPICVSVPQVVVVQAPPMRCPEPAPHTFTVFDPEAIAKARLALRQRMKKHP